MRLWAVEGNTQKLDGGAMFGNAPKAIWEGWIPPDEYNRITLACRALFLQTDSGRNILFEAGVGAFFEPKLRERYGVVEREHILLQSLAKLGMSETDIDAVVLSHLHFDHAGGILSAYEEGPLKLLFPNALFYTSKAHFDRALHPTIRDRQSFIPQLNELLLKSGRLRFIDRPKHPDLDFGLNFRFVHGHTIGLMVSILETAAGPLAFLSDLIPGISWMHLPITMGYDRFPEQVVEEKEWLLKELLQRQGFAFYTHDPKQSLARIMRDEAGRFYGEHIPLGANRELPLI